ncbi:cysteine--tRNA ligase [Kaistia terrae]|uniref:Cysteine--tRNA ligase n=1 Tax=Kaistia terrae TaxID=537017 RepID=A0ABW0PVF3_9HYPH|nr:cysteine--tRNA ligase [Kaistia terrae]MCX5577515.1 cysteine--tRNA ligase [Kaistia terrae]
MTLRLYNTLTKEKDALAPLLRDPVTGKDHVRMYVCGPTVYDFAHIGNARPVIVFDVLFRLLRHLYGPDHVTYVRNITDVDDKINARAAVDYPDLPLNAAIRLVTEKTDAQFQADVAALGCLPPTEQPRATEHIDGMKAMIERLVQRGVAYVAEGHVLFSPSAMDKLNGKLPRYGALARRSLDEMLAGARVDVAPYKKEPMDFVLWKPSAENEPGWPSPAGIDGRGRPGWHIECSAMSMAKLLEPFGGGLNCDDPLKNTFDIHGGGIDLVFPHHENEIAQSCCAFDAPRMANIWMHNGFLQVEGEKMSKSLGNFVTIRELLETGSFGERIWSGPVLRLAMLKTHYRQPIDWTARALEEAAGTINAWREIVRGIPLAPQDAPRNVSEDVITSLADDLNFSQALAAMHNLAREARRGNAEAAKSLAATADFIGLDRHLWGGNEDAMIFARATDRALDDAIDALIAARLEARRAKNFAEADRIRAELDGMGIVLKDAKDPVTGEIVTTWEVKR